MLLHICTNSLLIILFCCIGKSENIDFNDICGVSNGKRFYLDFGESGSLSAKYENHLVDNNESDKKFGFRKNNTDSKRNNKCSVEFITCPSCVIHVKFRFLNISRNCGKSSVFDSCGCDYVLITEPPFEDASGEQFCGRFIPNNVSEIRYNSQTRTVAINFIFSNDYGHAFTVDYSSERNRIHLNGHPKMNNMNNASQIISSPFFPNWYPPDLSVEYLINCWSTEPCRISLVFTDFLVADASILEFFDWNGQRIYVRNGNIFRPPVIISSGPSLIVRFYANGASDFGFKSTYSFILGNLDDSAFKPDIACGGHVNNLGGGITMMNMVSEGTKYFDCIWIVKPPGSYLHRKTHLYVKVVTFDDFAGTTEMVIRQGITSNEPSIEVFRFPFSHFNGVSRRQDLEHVVPLNQGFYISLKGLFRKESRLTIVYAAFNYKDCYSGSDFLCHNLRCIPLLLNCDGFDHCGDNSDESPSCSQDPMDHRQFSQIPNFLFPKMEPYSDMTAASLVFLICTFGCVGIIFAVGLLLYRVNLKARHQRQIQDHLETIHAILEEGVGGMEEEIIIPDDPPDYEPPPEYADVIRLQKYMESMASKKQQNKRCRCSTMKQPLNIHLRNIVTPESPTSIQSTSFLIQNESIPLNRSESCSTNDISCNTIIEHPLSDNLLEHPTNENDTQEESSSVVEQTKFNNEEALTSEENVSQTLLEESPKSINECTYCNLTDPCTSNTANLECSNNPEEDICRPSTSCADSVETSTKNTTGENNSSCSECSSSTSLEHSNKARFISVPVKRNFSAAISRPPGTIIQVCKRSKSCQTTPIRTIAIPDSPPPAYEQIDRKRFQEFEEVIGESLEYVEENCGSAKEEERNDAPISSTDSSDLQQSFPKNPFILAQHSTLNISETCVTKMSSIQEFKSFSESIQNNVKKGKSTTKLIKSFVSRSDEYLHNNSCSEYGINCKNTFRDKNLYKKCYSADNIYKL